MTEPEDSEEFTTTQERVMLTHPELHIILLAETIPQDPANAQCARQHQFNLGVN